MEYTIVAVLFLVLAIAAAFVAACVVPQGENWVIVRFGKFRKILKPGLGLIVPFLDKVQKQVNMKVQAHNIENKDVITKDNARLNIVAAAFVSVAADNADKAIFQVENYTDASITLIQTTIRGIIGKMTLNECMSSRDVISERLLGDIKHKISEWGVEIKQIDIKEILPSTEVQGAMDKQASAEKEKVSVVVEAEAKKNAAILESEGRLISAQNDAKAEIERAEGSRQAIVKILGTLKGTNQEVAYQYLIAQKYLEAIEKMGASENSKIVLLPADIQKAVSGLFATLPRK